MKRGGLVVFAMVLITGMFRLAGPAINSGSAPKSTESAAASVKSKTLSTLALHSDIPESIQEFYGATETDPSATDSSGAPATGPTGEASNAAKIVGSKPFPSIPHDEAQSLRFLIAFVPDPIHTHLALLFDRSIDAIQQAAQAEGCSFDRAVVPWDPEPYAASDDPKAREALKNYMKAREQWPGLMIFRKGGKGGEPAKSAPCVNANVFVFLVGESPTGGIRKEQFDNALLLMQKIRGQQDGQALNEPLYLLGPFFSGSLFSLKSELERKKFTIGEQRISVYSGTITNLAAQQAFESRLETAEKPPDIHFATFQENDDYVVRAFAQLACTLGYHNGEIAVVSEDETAFGKPGDMNGISCHPGEKKEPQHAIASIQFPREISQLRAAYQSVPSGNATANPGRLAMLPLDLQLTGNDDDTVPDFARQQTPLSQESVLLAITDLLHKHHTKLVLLLATDPMDQLFLAQFIRRAYPLARVGVTSPDLLFAREGDALLSGTFGLSSYALVPGADENFYLPAGTPRSHGERVFPSTISQGMFNAAIGLLEAAKNNCEHPSIVKLALVPTGPYAAYSRAPVSCSRPSAKPLAPAVQLTILGRDGYWLVDSLLETNPLDLTPSSPKPQFAPYARENHSPQHLPMSLNLALLVVIILGALHVWLSCTGSILAAWEVAAQFAPIGNVSCKSKTRVRDWLIAVGTLAIATAYILLLTARIGSSYCGLVPAVTVVTAALVFLLVPFTGFSFWDLNVRRKNLPAALFVAIGVAVLFFLGASVVIVQPTFMSWLLSSRSIHLTSGCSAALAVLPIFAGMYWWVWYGLRGMVLTDDHRPRLPEMADLPKDFTRLSDGETQGLRNIANPIGISSTEIAVVICALVLIVVLPDRKHPIQTLEGVWFDWLYCVLLLILGSLLAWNLAKVLRLWGECRRVLMAIDRVPLREVFGRLDGFAWSSLWSPGSSSLRESYRYVARQIESIRRLGSAIEEARPIGASKRFAPQGVVDQIDATAKVNAGFQEKVHSAIGISQTETNLTVTQIRNAIAAVRSAINSPRATIAKLRILITRQPADTSEVTDAYVGLLKQAAKTAGTIASQLLEPEWNSTYAPSAAETPQKLKDDTWSKDEAVLMMLAEECVALTYVSFLAMVLVRVRSLVMVVVGLYVFLLLSISFYPFQPSTALLSIAVGLFIVCAAVIGYVYAQMHKDATLSRLTNTKEGELDLQFWAQIVGAGAIPLLTLLAGQIPAINQVLVNFLEPALQAVK